MSGPGVSFTRLPLVGLIACTVPVIPGTPKCWDGDDPLPMDERTEVCACDAQWLLGLQPLCDVHCRDLFEHGMIEGTFEDLVRDALADYAYNIDAALDLATVPWEARTRMDQTVARDSAKALKPAEAGDAMSEQMA